MPSDTPTAPATVPTMLTYDCTGKGGRKYESFIVDIHPAGQYACMDGGLTHELGNVVASQLVSWIRTKLTEGKVIDAKTSAETIKASIQAYRQVNTAAVLVQENVLREAKWQNILNGTVSTRAGGPRGPKDEVGDRAWDLANRYLAALAAADKGAGHHPDL